MQYYQLVVGHQRDIDSLMSPSIKTRSWRSLAPLTKVTELAVQ